MVHGAEFAWRRVCRPQAMHPLAPAAPLRAPPRRKGEVDALVKKLGGQLSANWINRVDRCLAGAGAGAGMQGDAFLPLPLPA